MNNEAMFSSEKHDWSTPQELYDKLNKVCHFTIDACASDWNNKHERYWTIKDNALTKDWSKEIAFMNPPYGRTIKHWVKKAYEESKKGGVIIALLPVRTDTKWWHNHVQDKAQVIFLNKRLKFSNKEGTMPPAPFPSCIALYENETHTIHQ